jgi:hypothetical protein
MGRLQIGGAQFNRCSRVSVTPPRLRVNMPLVGIEDIMSATFRINEQDLGGVKIRGAVSLIIEYPHRILSNLS